MPRPRPPASIASRQEDGDDNENSDGQSQSDSSSGPDSDEDSLVNLFCPDGHPCRFFLHKSMTDEMKTKATKKISTHGGQITTHERKAHVILVFEARLRMSLAIMQLHYNANEDRILRNIYVEPHTFLTKCINMGHFKLGKDKRIKMGMPGPRPRRKGEVTRRRVEYTDEDDDHLCFYMAQRVPDPKEGGRMGNVIYKELEKLGHSDKQHWSNRHPWQSWRNRYSNNREVMDERIAECVTRIGRNGKGEYQRARKAPRSRGVRTSKRSAQTSESDEASESSSTDAESEEEDELCDDGQNDDNSVVELQALQQEEEEEEEEPASVPSTNKRNRPDHVGIRNVKEGEASGNGGGKKRIKMVLDGVEIPVIAHKPRADKGEATKSDVDVTSGGKGKGKRRAKENKKFESRSSNLDNEEDIPFDNDDANMADPLSTLNDQGLSNTTHASPRSSHEVQNQGRQLRTQDHPRNSQVTVMTSSQATLVPTQARAQPASRLTREQTRAAEVRAQASLLNAGGSGAVHTGPMMGETNDDEEEVDQLLDEDPSGTVDLDGRDEEEQELEDDAQIRRALENPGDYKIPEDESQHSEGDEDESESESEDDLTKLQRKANSRSNPAPNVSTKTIRRYIPLSRI